MNKYKILFVCLGNICRSPAAEAVMRSMVESRGLSDAVEVDSAGIIGYHEGEQADPRMRSAAFQRGYRLTSISRPVRPDDFHSFDLIVGMDNSNLQSLRRMAPPDAHARLCLLTDFCADSGHTEVPDPYYGGLSGFVLVLDILEEACGRLLATLQDEKSLPTR